MRKTRKRGSKHGLKMSHEKTGNGGRGEVRLQACAPLVVSPTRELCYEIRADCVRFGQPVEINSRCMFGGDSKKLQLTTHDANLTQLNVQKLRETQTAKGGELEAEAEKLRELQADVRAAEEALLSQQQLEHVQASQTRTQAALAARLLAEQEGRYTPAASAEALREQLADGDDTAARLLTVVENLSQEHPKFSGVLSSMVQAISAP